MVRTAELHARWDRWRARYEADLPLEARLGRARFRYEAAKVERAWAVVSAHAAGLSVRKIAAAVGLGPTRVHQLLRSPEAAPGSAVWTCCASTAGPHPRTRPRTLRPVIRSATAWRTGAGRSGPA